MSRSGLELNTSRIQAFRPVAVLRRLVAGFPPRRSGFDPKSKHVGFVAGKVALGQVFYEYFVFPCQFSFHQMLQNNLSSGDGIRGQLVAYVPLHFTPRNLKNKSTFIPTPLPELPLQFKHKEINAKEIYSFFIPNSQEKLIRNGISVMLTNTVFLFFPSFCGNQLLKEGTRTSAGYKSLKSIHFYCDVLLPCCLRQ
jgi:hypothetical protein